MSPERILGGEAKERTCRSKHVLNIKWINQRLIVNRLKIRQLMYVMIWLWLKGKYFNFADFCGRPPQSFTESLTLGFLGRRLSRFSVRILRNKKEEDERGLVSGWHSGCRTKPLQMASDPSTGQVPQLKKIRKKVRTRGAYRRPQLQCLSSNKMFSDAFFLIAELAKNSAAGLSARKSQNARDFVCTIHSSWT